MDRPSMFDLNLPCDSCGKNLAAIHVCGGCNDTLRAQNARLRELFARYAGHAFDCNLVETDICTCGLAEARRALEEGK